jgi:hypothetical protein
MLVCMGRDVSFVLRSRLEVSAKRARDGMLYDASGTFWPTCSLLVMPFEQGDEEVDEGKDYFGRKTTVFKGWVQLPPRGLSGWRELGAIKDVFYDRAGKHEGYFRHEFNKPRGLWRVIWPFKKGSGSPALLYARRGCYRIELPEGCVVDDRGFVVP